MTRDKQQPEPSAEVLAERGRFLADRLDDGRTPDPNDIRVEMADRIDALLVANERLREGIQAAFNEGWEAANDEGGYIYHADAWQHSKARSDIADDR